MSMPAQIFEQPMLHLRLNGHSAELPLRALRLTMAASDEQVKQAVARNFECPVAALDQHVVIRHQTTIVVRPEAIYG